MTSRPSSGRRPPPRGQPGLLRPRLLLAAFTVYCLVMKRWPWAALYDCAAGAASLLSALAGVAATAAAPPPDAGDELAAAIRNATSDFQELSALVRAFLRRPDAHPDDPAAFAAFLAVKARRPHRSLERALDWVLWVYRTLWPVLLIVLAVRMSSAREEEPPAAAPARRQQLQQHHHHPPSLHYPSKAARPLSAYGAAGVPGIATAAGTAGKHRGSGGGGIRAGR